MATDKDAYPGALRPLECRGPDTLLEKIYARLEDYVRRNGLDTPQDNNMFLAPVAVTLAQQAAPNRIQVSFAKRYGPEDLEFYRTIEKTRADILDLFTGELEESYL
jgi:hypothetical protein